MNEESVLIGLLLTFIGFFILLLLIGIIFYILHAIGLYKIAKRADRGDLAILAWIPIANTFLMTLLVENDVHKELRGKVTLIYGISFVVSVFLSIFIQLAGFISLLIIYYAFYFLAKKLSPNPVLHIVIAIVTLGISMPIQIFMFRNREFINPEDQGSIIDA